MTATPVVVQAAVTGGTSPDGASPNLPLTPASIADAAVEAWRAGAAVVHIHARTAEGVPTGSAETFRMIVDRIRAAGSDVILNLSTGSGGNRIEGADRYSCLDLGPEMGSFDCGSLNFGDRIFANSPSFLRDLAAAFERTGVVPEIECFDTGHVIDALRLRDEGLLADPLRFQFVLGVQGGAPATLDQVLHMRGLLPQDAIWSLCALGRAQLTMNAFSLLAGGHVRTGLEDNVYYRRGELATGNGQLVERVVRLAKDLDRPVATTGDAREILQLE